MFPPAYDDGSDRGLFTMEFSHYEEVPSHMTAKLLEQLNKDDE